MRAQDFQCPFLAPLDRFNVRDRKDQDWILWWLDQYRVPFSLIDVVGRRLHGDKAYKLGDVIAAVMREEARRARSEPAETRAPAGGPSSGRMAELRQTLRPQRRAAKPAASRGAPASFAAGAVDEPPPPDDAQLW